MKEALKVAERYPDIVCEVENVDTICYKLSKDPT